MMTAGLMTSVTIPGGAVLRTTRADLCDLPGGSVMSDRIVRGLASVSVLIVAAIAAIISYVHIQHLALTHGQDQLAACLTPLSIDGAITAASLVMLQSARNQQSVPWLARGMLGVSVAATLAANLAFGAAYGPAGALISGWPALAFTGCIELGVRMSRVAHHTARPPVPEPTAEDAARRAYIDSVKAGTPLSEYRVAKDYLGGLTHRRQAARIMTEARTTLNGKGPA